MTRRRCCRPIRTYGADDGPGRLAENLYSAFAYSWYFFGLIFIVTVMVAVLMLYFFEMTV